MKKILTLLILLSLLGCVQKINYQVDGQPIMKNVVVANVMSSNIKVKYALINNITVKEDDEFYFTQEMLNLNPSKLNKIENSNSLNFRLYVYNPDKMQYQIKTYIHKKGGQDSIINEKLLYNGNLSRNEYLIELPINEKSTFSFYFELLNEKNDLMFKSFETRYKIAN